MRARQQLWHDIFETILKFCLGKRSKANKLPNSEVTADGMVMVSTSGSNRRREAEISITYPSILERDIKPQVDAVVNAATLDGKAQAGIFEIDMLTRMLLEALNVDDIDAAMAELFPEGVDEEGVPLAAEERLARARADAEAAQAEQPVPAITQEALMEAIREFTTEVRALREKHTNGKQPAEV
jgi:hypothetical protein